MFNLSTSFNHHKENSGIKTLVRWLKTLENSSPFHYFYVPTRLLAPCYVRVSPNCGTLSTGLHKLLGFEPMSAEQLDHCCITSEQVCPSRLISCLSQNSILPKILIRNRNEIKTLFLMVVVTTRTQCQGIVSQMVRLFSV